ncbi:beta-1,3-galactosyltransferase 5-like [Plodia interpunctella]|uniref:beta-1,3-galactosyltransferase 5-like n=1 Tax=Plodia interpunctella TaxID=58824 RepID=UPI002367A897|nr:beta-1,3-galactosyltransferase 5-like [Plodia interpunctella]
MLKIIMFQNVFLPLMMFHPCVLSTNPLQTHLLGPGDQYMYKHTEDVYNHLIDLTNFTFLTNPTPCNDQLLLLVMVTSKWTHYERRRWIRETWKAPWEWARVIFLIGEPSTSNAADLQSIRNESKHFGDIVLGNFVDVYFNVTYKHTMGLKWVAHHCPVAKYILKLDDDVEVRPAEFREFLGQRLSPWGARRLIVCNCYVNQVLQSKYKMFVNQYCGNGALCPGWVMLYSQDAVQDVLKVIQSLPYSRLDDIHITLTCAAILGIPKIPLNYLERSWRMRFKPDTLINSFPWPVNRENHYIFRLLH